MALELVTPNHSPAKIPPKPTSKEAFQQRLQIITNAIPELDLSPDARACMAAAESQPHFAVLIHSIAGTPAGSRHPKEHCIPELDAYCNLGFDNIFPSIQSFRRQIRQLCGTGAGNGNCYYGRPQKNGDLRFTPTGLMHMLSGRTDAVGRAYRELFSELMRLMTTVYVDQMTSHLTLSALHRQNRIESVNEFNDLKDKLVLRQPGLKSSSAQGVAANLDRDWQCKYLGIDRDDGGRYRHGPRDHINSIIPHGLKPRAPVADAYDVEGVEALSAGRAVIRQHVNRLNAADLPVTNGKGIGMKRKIQEREVANQSLDSRLDLIKQAFTFDDDPEEHVRKAVKRPSILHNNLPAISA